MREERGGRRGGRDHGRGEREFERGRGRDRRGGGRRGDRDRDHELEVKEREGEGVTSPTKEGERVHFKIFKNVEREKLEQQRQMDQDFPALVKNETSPTKEGPENPDLANIILKQRDDSKRSESPAVSKVVNRRDSVSDKAVPKLRQAIKFVDENHVFCDGINDFMTDNTDFVVIGVFGLQNAGKSTIINALAKLCPEEEDIFRVQGFEHQMLAEHCTNGIDIYVNARRFILLDCQPLLSASVMDRTIQLEKKYTSEFNSTENTMEVHSLQQIGFLFSVCHTVLLVQDWFTDVNLIRMVMAAEMLKPVTPTVNAEDKTVTEYFPHFVIVQNKAEFTDTEPEYVEEIEGLYARVLKKSRLQWRKEDERPLVVMIPDQEGERADELKNRMKPNENFEEAVKTMRKTIFSLKRSPLTQAKLTEKGWVSLANRTWDNIKNSPFYMEYSRLLP